MTADVTQVTVVGETTVISVSGSVTAPVITVNANSIPVVQASVTAIPTITVSAGIQGPPGITGPSGVLGLPSQTSNGGKYLTTDGANLSWATVQAAANLNSFSVVTTSPGTQGLTYNNTTGVFTFTPSNAITTFSVVTASPGTQGLGYNSGTGVFTFTPASLTAYALTSSLATVATSGSYADLTNKPTITPQIQSDWNQVTTTALDYIKNKPTIPSVPTYTVSTAAASGGGSLSLSGSVFTFTPPNLSSYLTSITSSNVTTALGFTPYNATNPSNYITTGSLSVTTNSASGAGSLSYTGGVFTFTPAAAYSLPTATTTVLGGVKVDGTTISITGGVISAISSAPNLTVTTNAAGGGGSLSYLGGVLTFTPPNLSSYLTSITSSNVTTALGFTPIQASSLSVTTNSASGGGSLSYSNGVFTFTPAATYTLTSSGIQTAFGSSLTAHTFYAAPVASAGSASFRTLDATDIPALNYVSTTGSSTITDSAAGPNYTLKLAGTSGTGSVFGIGTGSDAYGIANDALNHSISGYVPYTVSASTITFKTGASLPATALSIASSGAVTIGSLSGLLKGTAGVISAATAGTDYQAPVSATGILKSNGTSGNISAASAGVDYIVPYGSTTANYVLASPNGSAGTPTFRALVAADIPTIAYTSLSGTPTLATVATSGSYADLSNKPTIPNVPTYTVTTGSASGGGALSLTGSTFTFTPASIPTVPTYTVTTGSASGGGSLSLTGSTFTFNPAVTATWPVSNTNGASGPTKIAIGTNAGATSQGVNTVAIGNSAGNSGQGGASVSIGFGAGNSGQGNSAIAIGLNAGSSSQGAYSIAIGSGAGSALTNAQAARTIILNASGSDFDGVASQTDSFYVAPIRTDATPSNVLYYNNTTKEVTYGTAPVNYTLPTATTSVLGGVKVDGTTITITGGVISSSGGGTTLPSQTGNSGKYLTTDGSNLSWGTVSGGGSFTGGTVANATTFQSSVTFSPSTSIIGDFDNATFANRTLFTTSTTNASTGIYAVPNGTNTSASWQALNNSVPTNASKILIAAGSTDVQLVSGINGTGTYLPLSFLTSGTTQMQLTTSGLFNVNQESINGTGMNLIYPSQGFNATYWTVSALTVTANSILAPDGTTTGATFTGSGANGAHSIFGIATYTAAGFLNSTNLSRTISCYFQKGTSNFVQLAVNSTDVTVYANYDLNNGVLGTVGAGCTATITAVPNYAGWYRCTMTWTAATISNVYMFLISTATAVRAESNTLSTTIYAWGIQCEYGPTARTYLATTNAYVYGTPQLQINNNSILSLDTTGNLSFGGNLLTTTVGSLSTTVNIANGLTSTSTQSVGIATGTNSGTKTINIGTGGGGANITLGAIVSGTTIINSSTVQGAATTQTLYNTVATTLNFAGAAQALYIGSTASGSVTTLNAPTVIGSATTQNLYNTVATTVNEFGVATTINVAANAAGATTWTLGNSANSNTLTIAGGTTSGTDSISTTITTGTVNVLTGVVTGGTINIGGAGSNTVIGGILTTSTSTTTNAVNITYTPATALGAAIQATGKDTIGGTGYFDFFKATNTTSGVTNANKTLRLTSTGNFQLINSAYTSTLLDIDDSGNTVVAGNLTINGVNAGYAPNRPAFRVVGNGGAISSVTTVTSSNWTLDYQQGSALNTTTGIFTAPVAGLYMVNLVIRTNSNTGSLAQAVVRKTAVSGGAVTAQIMVEFAANTTMNHAGGSTIVKMAVGDTLKLDVTQGTLSFDGNDNWSVAYLG